MKKIVWAGCSVWLAAALSGCYYDKEAELYPTTSGCDTTATVSYASYVSGLMQTNCNGCHSSSGASGGIVTDNHADLKTIADNGTLYGSISHSSGFRAMPQGGDKLDSCDIAKVQKWINAGAPNN